jgi:hypothetical protein
MTSSQYPVEVFEGGRNLLILTSEGATVNKQRGDVVFPSAMVSMEVEELGEGVPLTKPSEAELLSSNRTLERGEAKNKKTKLEEPPQRQFFWGKRPGLLHDLQAENYLFSDLNLHSDAAHRFRTPFNQ